MSTTTQKILALIIGAVLTIGIGGCLDGGNRGRESRTPRMKKIVFKDSVAGRDTSGAMVAIPQGDSAFCSPTDLRYSGSDTTLMLRARIYHPIAGTGPFPIIETTQPVTVGILAD